MYLLDTNILLEILLKQPQANSAKRFMRAATPGQLHLSDFSLHSLGVRLIKLQRFSTLERLASDLIIGGGIRILRLDAADLSAVAECAKKYGLDFDDAYQYIIAERFDLVIVTFDLHFDATPRGRKTPKDLIP